MKTNDELKTWLQHRIDYWEKVVLCEETIKDEGYIPGARALVAAEHKGLLAAFYQVMESIEEQRK